MNNTNYPGNKYRELLAERLPSGWRLSEVERARNEATLWLLGAPDGQETTLRVVVSSSSEARGIRTLLAETRNSPAGSPDLLVAPFLGPRIRNELANAKVGYLDLTGNCRLEIAQPGIVIDIQGADRNPNPTKRPVQSLSGPRMARILRNLCLNKKSWGIRELASETGLDAGYVSRVLDYLYREALIDRGRRNRVEYVDWEAIIRHWSLDAPLENRGPRLSCIAPRGLPSLLANLASSGLRHVVSGSLAAVRKVEIAPPRMGLIYTQDSEAACDRLECQSTQLGANLILIEPKDEVLLDCFETGSRGIRWACLPQVAVDLMSSPGRGPAEAEALIKWMKVNEDEWRR